MSITNLTTCGRPWRGDAKKTDHRDDDDDDDYGSERSPAAVALYMEIRAWFTINMGNKAASTDVTFHHVPM